MVYAHCLCHGCGKESDIAFSRLLYDGVKECRSCARKNLALGYQFVAEIAKDGTRPDNLLSRNLNKNSSTGVRGVSQMKDGRYRAYINLRRKQYHLGCYTSMGDAVKARKEAEDRIYGDFLDWYKTEYPDLWDKVERGRRRRSD